MRYLPAARAILGSSLFRNSMALISGTVLTQALLFVCSPFLSRLFTVEEFGHLANYNAWVAILALVSCLRYEHAIIVAVDNDSINRVLALTASLCLFSLVLYSVGAAAVYVAAPDTPYLGDIRPVVLFIPLGVLAACVSSPLVQLNIKLGEFRRLSHVAVAQVIFTIVPQLLLGFLRVDNGLIIGTIVGYAAAGAMLARRLIQTDGLSPIRAAMRRDALKATAYEFRNFPRYTLPADAMSLVAQQFIPVVVTALFSPVAAGLFSFATRIVRVPLLVVSTALSSALRKEASERANASRSLSPLYRVTTLGLGVLAVPPFLALLVYAPEMFSIVFGSQWTEAGRMVRILSPGILAEFIALPLLVFFVVTHSQHITFIVQTTGFALTLIALVVGRIYLDDFMRVCYLVSAVMLLVNAATIVLAGRLARRTGQPVPAAASA